MGHFYVILVPKLIMVIWSSLNHPTEQHICDMLHWSMEDHI
jgi:hypothetical protein